ncbi:hypothetical protein [Xanthomonas phage OP1]|uniref:dATP/dGTP diphosphohydrolase N-terminal domain-containing protein n=1 Tax=Xanthomonas phage OP1 TaxID=2994040 RepID=Q2NPF7_9CAUD|nr:hypothetical protein OP1_ORF34 [Xanthomonas phage OP1]BAE72739.1 hypothetical protein [Xanthomonas phage OP1]
MSDMHLPTDSAERKGIPLAQGVLYYFPAALAEIAKLSKAGNDKHSPGKPLHHARGKSTDHADCIIRHLIDSGTIDPEDGMRHSAKVAWRALALLQEELEQAGAPLARNARLPEATQKESIHTKTKAEKGTASADGWFDNFGKCPVALGEPIRVKYRCGEEADCTAGDFHSISWKFINGPFDIVAWQPR